jgi:hypothetical protein
VRDCPGVNPGMTYLRILAFYDLLGSFWRGKYAIRLRNFRFRV